MCGWPAASSPAFITVTIFGDFCLSLNCLISASRILGFFSPTLTRLNSLNWG